MQFRRVIVNAKCLSAIKDESRKAKGVETGGPLVGYVQEDREALVVVDAGGPGPRARFEPFSVTIDGAFAQRFCDDCYNESNGRFDYVGDWHKHPGLSLNPSKHDIEAIKAMAEFEQSPTKFPISLIFSTWLRRFRVFVWDGTDSLVRIPSAAESQRYCRRLSHPKS